MNRDRNTKKDIVGALRVWEQVEQPMVNGAREVCRPVRVDGEKRFILKSNRKE